MHQFKVTGMRCGGCSGRVKRLIVEHLPDALVSIELSDGLVSVDHSGTDPASIIKMITDAGFGAQIA